MNDDKTTPWIQQVRSLVSAEKVALKKHCVLRMRQRKISVHELKEAMAHAEIVEYYADDHPLPSALVLGFTSLERPLHAVVAMDQTDDMLWIITLYEPDAKMWGEQFNERRS